MATYIDLTHKFLEEMPTYPGDPAPEIVRMAKAEIEGYNDFQVKTGMHVGTHMDGPLHMVVDGKYLSDFPVEKFFGRGVLINVVGADKINASFLKDGEIKVGDIVLVRTDYSKKYRTSEYYETYPEITEDFAQKAIDLGVSIIGMDTPSPDRPPFSVHKMLLVKDILIIENLTNLDQLEGRGDFEVVALPANFHTEAAPVRVVAKYDNI